MSFYHPSIYAFDQPVESYWEDTAPDLACASDPVQSGECDIAIIGGGYTGLSAALALARDHDVDVRVLEAGPIAWGASGRNGGFCGLHPSKLDYLSIEKTYGGDEARKYVHSQVDACEQVAGLIEDEHMSVDRQGDGIISVAHSPSGFDELRQEQNLISERYGLPARLMSADEFSDVGYRSEEQFGALWTGVGFGLHPLQFARGLADAATRRGARLHAHSRVTLWDKVRGWHVLRTATGTLRAKRVIVATNGFTQDKLHAGLAGKLMPVLSNIIVTRPLSDEELARQNWRTDCPCANTRNLLFYYRVLPDKRFLFGARGDTTGSPKNALRMRAWLERRLGEVFPGWQGIPVTHYWRGLIGTTRNLTPAIGFLEEDPTVAYGVAFHGDGVAAAPWTGQRLAELVTGNITTRDLPAVMRGPLPPIPFPALRPWYLRGALRYYQLLDRS